MKNNRNKKIDGQKIFSIVASLAIVAALVAGIVSVIRNTVKENRKKNYIDLNVVDNETEAETIRETETRYIYIESPTQAETKEYIRPTEAVTEEPVKDVVADVAGDSNDVEVNAPVYSFSETDRLSWPVQGNILLGFNMDNTIYFPTLDVYRCNPAVMITADVGTEVVSSAGGVVKEVYSDNETGTTVKIAIGDGYEITYGQLTDLAVGISDTVEVGTVLGKIAEPTKYYTKEGSNLYFKLTKDGVAIDPLLYLEE